MAAIDTSRPLTVLFGCGYVGTRLARALLDDGNPVRACARHLDKLAPLADLGAELFPVDATKVKQFGPALRGAVMSTVVYSIPPPSYMPGGESVRRAASAALAAGARTFIYLSTCGLYGSSPSDEWVDEDTQIDLADPVMAARHQEEAAVQSACLSGLRTIVLRLAPVYGPGRGVRTRLRKGDYKIIDEGQHYVPRIHVDDLVQIIRAADDKAPQGATYLVGDDLPTRQREYTEWLCARLKLPLPPSVPSIAPGVARTALRGRRLRNDKLKRELGVVLRYPTYVEGEAQIEAEEAGGDAPIAPVPAPSPTEFSAPVVAAAGPAAPAPAPVETAPPVAATARPASIRALATLPTDEWTDATTGERFAHATSLGRVFGLARVGAFHVTVAPGHRTSLPHAHSDEEELTLVLEGQPDVWLDGTLHRLAAGDVVAFPSGTGTAHTILNNTDRPVRLLVVGEAREGDRVRYPLHPEAEAALPVEKRWSGAPHPVLGEHDGKPR